MYTGLTSMTASIFHVLRDMNLIPGSETMSLFDFGDNIGYTIYLGNAFPDLMHILYMVLVAGPNVESMTMQILLP